jgi:hypothetical protein
LEFFDRSVGAVTYRPWHAECLGEGIDVVQGNGSFAGQGDESNIGILERVVDLNQIGGMRSAGTSPTCEDIQDNNFSHQIVYVRWGPVGPPGHPQRRQGVTGAKRSWATTGDKRQAHD